MPPLSHTIRHVMRTWRHSSRLNGAGIVLAALMLCTTPQAAALAQGVCVVCNEPDAVYLCQRDDGVKLRPGDTRLNLLCITELARAGAHATCSVRRQQTGTCEGQRRTVAVAPAPPLVDAPAAPLPGDQAQDRKSGPPETVVELAKRTASTSKEQLEKATGAVGDVAKKTGDAVGDAAKKTGSVVGDAAKKSWHCLTSLFTNC